MATIELLTNGSFEDGLTAWHLWTPDGKIPMVFETDTGRGGAGTKCLKLTSTDTGYVGNVFQDDEYWRSMEIAANTTISVKLWVKTTDVDGLILQGGNVAVYEAGTWNFIEEHNTGNITGTIADWTLYEYSFVTPNQATSLHFGPALVVGKGDIYIDDCSMTRSITASDTQEKCGAAGGYWYDDACHAAPSPSISYDTFYSGYLTRFQKTEIVGHYSKSGGGDLRSIEVCASGEVIICSGVFVTANVIGLSLSGLDIQVNVSGDPVQISGQHVFVESGVHVVGEFTADISGATFTAAISGKPVTISGDHVYVESGVHVIGDFVSSVSGNIVQISGQHVFVESGVHVVAAVSVDSGLGVLISGQHVFVESGVHIIGDLSVSSGLGVLISGQHVFIESGAHVVTEAEITVDISGDSIIISGQPVTISGDHVFVESGVHVIATVSVDSGLGVLISGQHVYVESGAHVVVSSGLFVAGAGSTPATMSGAYDATAVEIITDDVRMDIGGTSGLPNAASGGQVLYSGNILAVEIKALVGNACDLYVGGVNHRPSSGHGYQLAAGEIKDIEINSLGAVYIYTPCSGDQYTWMAVV